MLAAPVGIEGGAESDVRAVVVADDGFGGVPVELSLWRGIVWLVPIGVAFVRERLEAVGRVLRRAATPDAGSRSLHTNMVTPFGEVGCSSIAGSVGNWYSSGNNDDAGHF